MDNTFIRLKSFLEDTNNFEELLESDTLIWVDHREYDEDIISYVNEKLEDKIEIVLKDNGKPYGEDIYLKHKDKINEVLKKLPKTYLGFQELKESEWGSEIQPLNL